MLVALIQEEGVAAVVLGVVSYRPMAPVEEAMEAAAMEEKVMEEAVAGTVRVSPRLFAAVRIHHRNSSSTTPCQHRCRRLNSLRRCW